MSDDDRPAVTPRGRLPSVFDHFPPGAALTLADLERAMAADTERRIVAALDRALARLADADGRSTEEGPPRSAGSSPP